MRVEWSQHAVADLRRISEYIGQDRSLEVANRISRVIYDAIQSLQTMLYQGALDASKTPAKSWSRRFPTSLCTGCSKSDC
jgi:plasmid stabilization system protein ParE